MDRRSFDVGLLIGVLVGEGSFGGDGRQPAITVRMHTRHEALFHTLQRIVPGARLYGPYQHSGRSYYQLAIRGPALRRLVPLLDEHLTPDIDEHGWRRYTQMKIDYRLQAPADAESSGGGPYEREEPSRRRPRPDSRRRSQ